MIHHIFCCRNNTREQFSSNPDNNANDEGENSYSYIDIADLQEGLGARGDNTRLSKPNLYSGVHSVFQNGMDDSNINVKNTKTVTYDNSCHNNDLPDKSDESKQSRNIAVSNGDDGQMYSEIPEQAERTDKYLQTAPSGDKAKGDNYDEDPAYADVDYAAMTFGASNQNMKDVEPKTSNDLVENATKQETTPEYGTVNKPMSDDLDIVENELYNIVMERNAVIQLEDDELDIVENELYQPRPTP